MKKSEDEDPGEVELMILAVILILTAFVFSNLSPPIRWEDPVPQKQTLWDKRR